jgi:hypothetical protein
MRNDLNDNRPKTKLEELRLRVADGTAPRVQSHAMAQRRWSTTSWTIGVDAIAFGLLMAMAIGLYVVL